jgi:hypothetical protein
MTQPNPLPPPLPEQVIPYATPGVYREEGGWREGDRLVVRKLVTLPPRCVKCNNDVVDGWRWRKTLYWHHPALALMIIFPGLLIYAIVAFCVRQKAMVEASLCEEHRAVRSRWVAATWILSLSVFVFIIGGIVLTGTMNDGTWAAIGIVGGIVALIAAIVVGNRARVLSPTRMNGDFAWLKGAGPEFLSSFPATGQ